MQYKHALPSLEEIVEVRAKKRAPYTSHKQVLGRSEKFALFMHRHVGSLSFFFLIFFWTIIWLAWNMFGPVEYRFDPAPAFVIWLFASNILQLILLPIIMVGQNIEGRAAEWRAQKDFEINQRAEEEIKIIIGHLENQNELLLELIKKIDRR